MHEVNDSGELTSGLGRLVNTVLTLACLGGVVAVMALALIERLTPVPPPKHNLALRLVPGSHDTLDLSPDVIRGLGIMTSEVRPAGSRDHLELLGSLFIDPGQSVQIRSRFDGEIIDVGPTGAGDSQRPLRVGDHVKKGQLLARIWSKDLGEKKSDLIDALSQLARDERQFTKLAALDPGVVSGKDLNEARQKREADTINVERLERTLRSWKLTPEEIDYVRAEAGKIHRGEAADVEAERHWAEVEVRAPFDGVILERNITLGTIVSTDVDLFKIVDLSTLGVLVNAYEEDLPALQALAPEARDWTVRVAAQHDNASVRGHFDSIGNVVDPTQHTAAVIGTIDNRQEQMRIGQFVTASVDLPPHEGEVAIPKSALIEQAGKAVVFVASNRAATRVERRAVHVARRTRERVYISSDPTGEAIAAGCKGLHAGELVIVSGAVELAAALDEAISIESSETRETAAGDSVSGAG
jgi:membrane fusion protein, heavy metal efflux system